MLWNSISIMMERKMKISQKMAVRHDSVSSMVRPAPPYAVPTSANSAAATAPIRRIAPPGCAGSIARGWVQPGPGAGALAPPASCRRAGAQPAGRSQFHGRRSVWIPRNSKPPWEL